MSLLKRLIKEMFKLSVITVVKNDNQNILKTVNSVLKQKNCKFEYIIFDGKSTDFTFNKLIRLRTINKNIKLFSQRDLNLYDGINTCIKKSSGDYIFLMHSGDIFYNDFVLQNIQKKLLNNPDIISGNIKYFDKNNKINRVWKSSIKHFNKFTVFKIPHTSLIIKKKIIKKVNFYNIEYNISSDMDLMIRLSNLKNIKFIYLNNYFTYMSLNGLSTSKSNLFKKLSQDFKILYKNYGYSLIIFYFLKIYFKFFQFLIFKEK